MMAWLAGCGPMVAGGGSEGGSNSESSSQGDEPTTDATITDATITVSSTAADTGAIDPPIECPTPGTCDGDCTAWQVEYRSPSAGKGQLGGVAIAPDGTIVAAGMADGDDLVLVGYDAGGALSWEETPLGTGDIAPDTPSRIVIANDGRIAVAGQHSEPGLTSAWLVVDRGDVKREILDFGGGLWISTVSFAADGSLIVGFLDTGGTPFVQRYPNEGAFGEEWSQGDLGLDGGMVLGGVATSASTIALVGMQGNEDDVWLASFDLENGLQWSVAFDGDPSTKEWANDVAVLPDGDLVVVGAQREDDGNALSWVGRFAPDGENRWARTYPGTGCCANALDHVEVDADGRVFVLGVRAEPLVTKVQEIDCEGEIVWEWNRDSPPGASSFPSGLAWSSATGLVAVGTDYVTQDDVFGFVSKLAP